MASIGLFQLQPKILVHLALRPNTAVTTPFMARSNPTDLKEVLVADVVAEIVLPCLESGLFLNIHLQTATIDHQLNLTLALL